jgi:anion-transporting  ArsA/GET3 family ATPase
MSEPQHAEIPELVDLVVTGHSSEKSVEALVRDVLNLLDDHSAYLEFKLSDALLFNNGMVSIREDISRPTAEALIQQLSTLRIHCLIRPTLQLVPKEEDNETPAGKLYICPACKHQQVQTQEHNEKCEECGVIGEHFLRTQRMKEAVELERQKYDKELNKSIKEAEQRAKQHETDILYQEARRQLGVDDTAGDTKLKIVAAIAALGIGLTALYLFN